MVAVAALALLAVASFDQGGVETQAERIQRLNGSFACPECRGESVADSNAAVAATIREFIADEVANGSTDTEIRNKLLQAYQTQVLLTPPAEGLATLLWILPVMLAVGGAALVTLMATRGPGDGELVTDDDRELVRQARVESAEPADEGQVSP